MLDTHIQEWESVEVKRSSSEALRRQTESLEISNSIIERYKDPSPQTPFALEYAYNLLGEVHKRSVLDFGCGAGENSVLIASHGGIPIGVDISPELTKLAERRMALHKYTDFEFKVGSAHQIPVDDESIDVVFGMAILHHLDLRVARKEVFRVLKKGGRAIFLEPVRNSKLVWFIRRMIPYTQKDVSPFERPLTDDELRTFAKGFDSFHSRPFSLPFVNLVEVLGVHDRFLHWMINIDGAILRLLPFLSQFASVRVVELRK